MTIKPGFTCLLINIGLNIAVFSSATSVTCGLIHATCRAMCKLIESESPFNKIAHAVMQMESNANRTGEVYKCDQAYNNFLHLLRLMSKRTCSHFPKNNLKGIYNHFAGYLRQKGIALFAMSDHNIDHKNMFGAAGQEMTGVSTWYDFHFSVHEVKLIRAMGATDYK